MRMEVDIDISDYVTRGILPIECADRKWRPVAYLSKLLNKTEQNYKIHDKKCWQ